MRNARERSVRRGLCTRSQEPENPTHRSSAARQVCMSAPPILNELADLLALLVTKLRQYAEELIEFARCEAGSNPIEGKQ